MGRKNHAIAQKNILPHRPTGQKFRAIMESVIIGIDPDIDKSGIAIIDNRDKTPRLVEMSIWSLARIADYNLQGRPAVFVVEAGWLNKTVWHGAGKLGVLPAMEVARRVGENHGFGKALVQLLKGMGFKVVLARPRAKKLCPVAVMAELGLDVKPSQEACDAYAVAKAYKLLKQ
jgi:hypothetical protein